MIGVVGGSGGVGASTFAAVVATVTGAMLVDLDASGGGIDVLLGVEAAPGARWSGLRVAGGRLDPAALADGLPRAGPCPVLAADAAPSPGAARQVIATAAAAGPVVLDLPRGAGLLCAAGVGCCDLLVVVARGDVCGVVAARAVAAGLSAPTGVVVRRGAVAASEAAALVGVPLLGVVPDRCFDPLRAPRAVRKVAGGVASAVRMKRAA